MKIKKRNIGIVLLWVFKAFNYFFPELIDMEGRQLINDGIDVLLLAGMTHSVGRTETAKKVSGKINTVLTKKAKHG